jgi:hypothetical protein
MVVREDTLVARTPRKTPETTQNEGLGTGFDNLTDQEGWAYCVVCVELEGFPARFLPRDGAFTPLRTTPPHPSLPPDRHVDDGFAPVRGIAPPPQPDFSFLTTRTPT